MIFNITSMLSMLAKIRRDSKMRIEDIDAIEWAKEAIDFVGVDMSFHEAEEVLTFVDFKVRMPMLWSNIAEVFYTEDDAELDDEDKTWVRLKYGEQASRYGTFTLDAYLTAKTEVLESTNTTVTRFASRAVNNTETEEYYYIEPGWIKMSCETGEIKVLGKKYPTDSDGMLMIPDTAPMKAAVLWYILMKAVEGGQKHPTLNYSQIEHKWNKYCGSAANDAMFPHIDKLRNQLNNDIK